MTSFGTVKRSKVFKMLDNCAKGHDRVELQHLWRIDFRGRTELLQLGKRSENDPEIQIGNVKKLVKALNLDKPCVKKYLPQLANRL